MAKSKRSRRAPRVEVQKHPVQPASPPAAVTTGPAAAPANNRKLIDFAQEYYYVFYDMRNIVLIGLLMFAVMVGLSFAI